MQKAALDDMFEKQSIRYRFLLSNDWLQEIFTSMDDKELSLYHDLPNKGHAEAYVETIIQHFGYLFAGKITDTYENSEDFIAHIRQHLLQDSAICFEQDTLVFERGADELYVYIHPIDEQNFQIKADEKNEKNEAQRNRLVRLIEKLLTPILHT